MMDRYVQIVVLHVLNGHLYHMEHLFVLNVPENIED